jgi:hypothetical protein
MDFWEVTLLFKIESVILLCLYAVAAAAAAAAAGAVRGEHCC